MSIIIAVTASGVGVFSAIAAMRAVSCARLQREFRAYMAHDDGPYVPSAEASETSHAA